jgi:hypothetical protein
MDIRSGNGKSGQVRFRFEEGKACPFFICEICGEPLKETGWVMVAWDMKREKSGDYVIYPIHKRNAAGQWCIRVLEHRIEKLEGGYMGTAELDNFLAQLTHNSGYKVRGRAVVSGDSVLGDWLKLEPRKKQPKEEREHP